MAIDWKDVVSGYSKIGVDWNSTITGTTVTYSQLYIFGMRKTHTIRMWYIHGV